MIGLLKQGEVRIMGKIEQADLFARFIHYGQTRRNGEDYVNHCSRVAKELALKGFDETIIIGGLLHDSLEDSKNVPTSEKMIQNYFGLEILQLIRRLTHKKGERYEDYMERIMTNQDSVLIKLEDIIDNTIDKLPPHQEYKYKRAIMLMISKGFPIPTILLERFKER